jgi:hypothetical protein
MVYYRLCLLCVLISMKLRRFDSGYTFDWRTWMFAAGSHLVFQGQRCPYRCGYRHRCFCRPLGPLGLEEIRECMRLVPTNGHFF